MPEELTTESVNPASVDLDRLDSLELVRLINGEDAGVAAAVAKEAAAIAQAIDLVAERMAAGGRLVYVGAGTSGRLGVLDAAECPPTFGVSPGLVMGLIAGGSDALLKAVEGAEDSVEAGANELDGIGVTAKDVIMGIAASGSTPYVLGAVRHASALGAATIGFSCNEGSRLAEVAELAITVVTGPEILSGSTRMKAGTATKMVLNMLTTGVMVRLGKTYGNLMVDLQATNRKLEDRSARILRQLTNLDDGGARKVLASCSGELKTAILSHRLSMTAGEARERLLQVGGRLREALEERV
ncbi:MAG: N-acetylmuramic acid 6-phosphate etherase [Gammaproteobacteria bacterium]|nr:N-acetylmuramic acid 6-phosphate etherase [Gammaproteobacteria bacterium]